MKVLSGLMVATTLSVLVFLLCEGIYAIAQWNEFEGSVTYNTYSLFENTYSLFENATDEGATSENEEDEGPTYTRLLKRDRIEALLPKLKLIGAGLGNSPYRQLKSDKA